MRIASMLAAALLAAAPAVGDDLVAYVTGSELWPDGRGLAPMLMQVDLASGTLTRVTPVGHGPRGVVLSPHARFAYVTGRPPTVVDTGTGEVVAVIPDVGQGTDLVALAAGGRALLMSEVATPPEPFDALISLISAPRRAPQATIAVPRYPSGIDVSAEGERAYVVGGGKLSILNLDARQVEAEFPARVSEPRVAVSRAGVAFVAGYDREGGLVYVLDLGTGEGRTVRLPSGRVADAIAASPDARTIWVSSYVDLVALDAVSGEVVAQIRGEPAVPTGFKVGLAFSPDGARIYFTNYTLGCLHGVDIATRASLGFVRLPTSPWGVAVGRRTKVACAGDCDGDHRVTVDELVSATHAALRNDAPPCDAFDPGDDATVSIDDLTTAAGHALDGCPD